MSAQMDTSTGRRLHAHVAPVDGVSKVESAGTGLTRTAPVPLFSPVWHMRPLSAIPAPSGATAVQRNAVDCFFV